MAVHAADDGIVVGAQLYARHVAQPHDGAAGAAFQDDVGELFGGAAVRDCAVTVASSSWP